VSCGARRGTHVRAGIAAGDEDDVTSRQTAQTFDRDARDGQRARHIVADQLEAWGLGPAREALELVVSELFANAVWHGAGEVEVRLSHDRDVVRLEVSDQGGGRPTVRSPDPSGVIPGGWGLQLVGQLVDDWGAEVTEGSTVVWAELKVRG
jgi:anti-sigma regulatory factor (Ser/Thr protein kinase)